MAGAAGCRSFPTMAPISEVNRLRSVVLTNERRQLGATTRNSRAIAKLATAQQMTVKRLTAQQVKSDKELGKRLLQTHTRLDKRISKELSSGVGQGRQAGDADDAKAASADAVERHPGRKRTAVLRGLRRAQETVREEQPDPDGIAARLDAGRRSGRLGRRQVEGRQDRRGHLVVPRTGWQWRHCLSSSSTRSSTSAS